MFCFADRITPQDLGHGVTLKILGAAENLNVVHWNMEDKAVVETHHHPQEQFGYVISGGFEVTIGDETATLKAGDSYFVPSNIPHRFVAIGKTEAIDVFSPKRELNYQPITK
jgi:quercetin dioxygenase-like cupin family protein